MLLIFATFVVMVTMADSRKPVLIDLTHELSPDFPVYPWFPRLNLTNLVREQRDGYWMDYNFIMTVDHVGTHMDAPSHFSEGNLRMHEVPINRFVGPGVVIKVADKVLENPTYQVTVDDILEWEARNGRIQNGSIVMMDAGWGPKTRDARLMFGTDDPMDPSTFHTPSFSGPAARFLQRRHVSIVGVDTISADPGDSTTFPAHLALLPYGVIVVENVANLDQVPETGSMIYCMPLTLRDASGSPMRAFAVIHDDIMLPANSAHGCSMSLLYVSLLSLIVMAYHHAL